MHAKAASPRGFIHCEYMHIFPVMDQLIIAFINVVAPK